MKRFFILGLLGGLFFTNTQAQQLAKVEVFHGAECPHCHELLSCFPQFESLFPHAEIELYEVWHNEDNRQLWQERLASFQQIPQAVPTLIFNNKSVQVGFSPTEFLSAATQSFGDPQWAEPTAEEPKNWWQRFLGWFQKKEKICFSPEMHGTGIEVQAVSANAQE